MSEVWVTSTAFGLLIGREELSFAASWALLFLEYPGSSALLMEQVLALELDNLLLVEDRVLANGTIQQILVIMIDCLLLFLSLIHLIEWNIVFLLIYLLEHSSMRIEPFLGSVLTHAVHRGVHGSHS